MHVYFIQIYFANYVLFKIIEFAFLQKLESG